MGEYKGGYIGFEFGVTGRVKVGKRCTSLLENLVSRLGGRL
jgi:hypothetical protein